MQTFQILSPPAETALTRERARTGPPPEPQSNELFDAVMGRMLARSPRAESDDSELPDRPPRAKPKPNQPSKSASNDPTQPDLCRCADNSAARVSPVTARVPEKNETEADTHSGVEAVSNTGQTTASSGAAQTNSSTPAGSGSDPTASGAPGARPPLNAALQPSAPDAVSPKNGASDPTATPGQEPSAECQLSAGAAGLADPKSSATDPNGLRTASAEAQAGSGDNPALQSVFSLSANVTGISSAQQPVAMQKAEKMNENSASTEQNLPVSVAGNAGQDLPVKAARPTNSPARTDQSGSGRDTGPSAAGVASSAQSVSSTGDSSQWPSTSPLRSVERAHDLMSLHAFRLRDSGADSLQVVIKPGPGLQMSLHLQMRDGNVEMRAILHRGDYDFLNRQWSQLQQQLEPRGVRLAPLVAGEQSANGGNSLSQEPGRRETEEDTAPAGAFPEFALAGALKPATAVKTKSLSGWESWA